jgi:imidazolonepropionase-like amidohydrolase
VRDSVPPDVLARLHQPDGPGTAQRTVEASVVGGADLIKLFTGSWVTNERAVPMRLDIARAAVETAHQRGRLVFAHASNLAGLEVALDAGVDVLAHAIDDTRGLTSRHYERMRERRMAMVPTLTVIGENAGVRDEVRQFRQAGGVVLFGTDAGYIQNYNPGAEYEWLARAGLGWQDILAALTTSPAAVFGDSARRGQLARGMAGDVVVLRADPAADVRAFADVRATIRAGRVIYSVR